MGMVVAIVARAMAIAAAITFPLPNFQNHGEPYRLDDVAVYDGLYW